MSHTFEFIISMYPFHQLFSLKEKVKLSVLSSQLRKNIHFSEEEIQTIWKEKALYAIRTDNYRMIFNILKDKHIPLGKSNYIPLVKLSCEWGRVDILRIICKYFHLKKYDIYLPARRWCEALFTKYEVIKPRVYTVSDYDYVKEIHDLVINQSEDVLNIIRDLYDDTEMEFYKIDSNFH